MDDDIVMTTEADAGNSRTRQLKNSTLDEQLPWVEKYRPQKLEDLVAHTDIINTITNLIDRNNLPHLLLYGPPGTGKTSTIVAAAKRMYAYSKKTYSSMVLELNASDTRGIAVVRNEIKEFAATKQLCFTAAKATASQSSSIKLIILDEADSMTNDAQFALRRIIEKYTKNVRFCIICNYVSKIIPALQSRCTKFRFAPLKQAQIEDRLRDIIRVEPACNVPGLEINDSAIRAILMLSNGDMRRVLNLLQATVMSNSNKDDNDEVMKAATVDDTAVYLTSGSPLPSDIENVLTVLFNETDFAVAYNTIVSMCTTKGYALADILTCLCTRLTNLQLTMAADDSKGAKKVNTASYAPKLMLLPKLYDGMSDIENRLSFGTNEKIQIASLVGVFMKARKEIEIVKGDPQQ